MSQQDNTETNDQSIIIEDLSAQNADEIKGGPTPKSRRVVVLQSSVAEGQDNDDNTLQGWSLNHNETTVSEDDEDEASAESLDDLPVAEAESEEVKGGPGGVWLNHNETVAADETQGASLADLTAQNADEIKGGPKRIFIGGLSVNEAPTALPDLEPSGEVKGGMQLRAKRSE